MQEAPGSEYLFPSPKVGTQKPYMTNLRKVWAGTLRRAGVPYFAPYELRHTFATRLSAGGVADHMVTQMLRQGDADVFKLYSQAKLGMMREALAKMDRQANGRGISSTQRPNLIFMHISWHSRPSAVTPKGNEVMILRDLVGRAAGI